ncbi:MAG: sensor histidine kinase [Gallionella sp.]|nr:sensor histidine kinase [Gallionella sp.]
MFPFIRFFLIFLSGSLFGTAAWCDDLIVARDVLVDPTGTLSIQEVVQADFKPGGKMLSEGYTDSVHWIRLRVRAPSDGGAVELRIRPSILDEVRLYEADSTAPDGWRTDVTGDRHAFGERTRVAVTLGFVVHPQAPQSTYYLRLQTASTSLLKVEALTPREASRQDLGLHLFQVFYLAVMLGMLLWVLHDYSVNRESLTVWFVIYQISYIAFDLAVMGYLAPFLPDSILGSTDLITSLCVISTVFLGIVFHYRLFRLYEPPRYMLNLLVGLMLAYPFLLIGLLSGYTRMALQINAIMVLLWAILLIFLSWNTRKESVPSRRTLRIIFGLQNLSLLISMLPLLGVAEIIGWGLYAAITHGLISGLLMFSILHMRARKIQRNGQLAELALEVSRRELKLERAMKEEQSSLVAMLTHEIKTPLAVVRMAMGSATFNNKAKPLVERAVSDMSKIIDRCQQVDQLEQNRLTVRIQTCNVDDLLRQLCARSEAPTRISVNVDKMQSITTDLQLVSIILSNLISNACKYAAPGTPIQIHVAPAMRDAQAGATINVVNEAGGAGLPDATRVFEKFYRSAGAHKQSGSGLGLYLARSLAKLLNGDLTYANKNNQASFTLWLPA